MLFESPFGCDQRPCIEAPASWDQVLASHFLLQLIVFRLVVRVVWHAWLVISHCSSWADLHESGGICLPALLILHPLLSLSTFGDADLQQAANAHAAATAKQPDGQA